MTQEDFEKLVAEAADDLPAVAKDKIKNVAFFVEPDARQTKADEVHIKRGEILLGLYQGVSQPNRGPGYFWTLPDRITIFQHPIEAIALGDPIKIRQIVFDVVRHEVGHHMGFDEAGIRAYEARRRGDKR